MSRTAVMGIELQDLDWTPIDQVLTDVKLQVSGGGMASVLSEDPETGARTVVYKMPPGWHGSAPEVHTVLQEEILLDGDMIVGSQEFHAPAYFCFPAGTFHGPFSTRTGCVAVAWYDGKLKIEYAS